MMMSRVRTQETAAAMLALLLALTATGVLAENIVGPDKYAWSENTGWVNANLAVRVGSA